MKKNVFLVSWEIERQSEWRSDTETDRRILLKCFTKIHSKFTIEAEVPFSFTIIWNGLGIFSNRTTGYLAVQLLDRYLFIDSVCRRPSALLDVSAICLLCGMWDGTQ